MTVGFIETEVERREISRLCHFTPMRNLVHIASSEDGMFSTVTLTAAERQAFNKQDRERRDGHPEHISCSIEYPNAYYLQSKRRSATGEARLFPDWVCVYVTPTHLSRDDTLLCTHNAAGFSGTDVGAGAETFAAMFADDVYAPQGRFSRRSQPECCPTDAQAEVLVHGQIPRAHILGFAVETEEQAQDTYVSLSQLGAPMDDLPILIVPDYWKPTTLATNLQQGVRPVETTWHPPKDDGHDEDRGDDA